MQSIQISNLIVNHDHTRILCCTNNGILLFEIPSGDLQCESEIKGGVHLGAFLPRPFLFAIITPSEKNKLGIWDTEKQNWMAEVQVPTSLYILKVLVRRNVIVCITETEVYLYSLSKLMLLEKFATLSNPQAVCALSTGAETLLACPTLHIGEVRLEMYDERKFCLFQAHKNVLAALALSPDGRWLASASGRGTLIRIWQVESRCLIQELRRGLNTTLIHSISFDLHANYLLCTSEKQTLHIFGTGIHDIKHQCDWNKKSFFYSLSNILPSYFHSQWSGATLVMEKGMMAVFDYQKQHEKKDTIILLIDKQAQIKEVSFLK